GSSPSPLRGGSARKRRGGVGTTGRDVEKGRSSRVEITPPVHPPAADVHPPRKGEGKGTGSPSPLRGGSARKRRGGVGSTGRDMEKGRSSRVEITPPVHPPAADVHPPRKGEGKDSAAAQNASASRAIIES